MRHGGSEGRRSGTHPRPACARDARTTPCLRFQEHRAPVWCGRPARNRCASPQDPPFDEVSRPSGSPSPTLKCDGSAMSSPISASSAVQSRDGEMSAMKSAAICEIRVPFAMVRRVRRGVGGGHGSSSAPARGDFPLTPDAVTPPSPLAGPSPRRAAHAPPPRGLCRPVGLPPAAPDAPAHPGHRGRSPSGRASDRG